MKDEQYAGKSTAGRGSSKCTNCEAEKDQCIYKTVRSLDDWKEGKEVETSGKEPDHTGPCRAGFNSKCSRKALEVLSKRMT